MGKWDHTKFTVEDFAAGFIRFENGACVVLESSFCANIKNDIFATELLGEKSGVRVVPHGEDHQVQVFGEADGALFRLQPTDLPSPSAYDAEVAAFVDAILEGKPSPVSGEQGLILNAIFDAMYRSSESGKEEPVNLAY
jgi:predicted dehydrogenase